MPDKNSRGIRPVRKVSMYIPADDDVVRDMIRDLLEYARSLQAEGFTGPIRLEHDEDLKRHA
jgi:hypothetical protein